MTLTKHDSLGFQNSAPYLQRQNVTVFYPRALLPKYVNQNGWHTLG